jgi:hypothetical protein
MSTFAFYGDGTGTVSANLWVVTITITINWGFGRAPGGFFAVRARLKNLV